MVQSELLQRTIRSRPARSPRPSRLLHSARVFSDLPHRPNRRDLWRLTVKPDETEDVIDLGAPRAVCAAVSPKLTSRVARTYTPNPRLYPGPQRPAKVKKKCKPSGYRGRRNNVYRLPLPNSRLYRPPPRRPSPPPAIPRTTWKPLPPRSLETASRVAIRLNERLTLKDLNHRASSLDLTPSEEKGDKRVAKNKSLKRSSRRRKKAALTPPRLVIKLPAAGDGNPETQTQSGFYQPISRHFQVRTLHYPPGGSTVIGGRPIPFSATLANPAGGMDATQRHSASPEDCSDGNDSLSAPSEFLAEFLSAIMRRQYAEALKYCRLILQYEPRNATARGFYPLLQDKLAQQGPRDARASPAPPARSPRHHRDSRIRASRTPDLGGASSGCNSGESSPTGQPPGLLSNEVMEQEADSLSCSESEGEARPGSAASSGDPEPGLGSVSSQSSLELDSSDAPARSSPSLSLSRRTDRTDPTDSASASGTWDSSGSGARDDNGNPAPTHTTPPLACCDAENNPAAAPRSPLRARTLTLQSEQSSESLRRLRAQFTCSIK